MFLYKSIYSKINYYKIYFQFLNIKFLKIKIYYNVAFFIININI